MCRMRSRERDDTEFTFSPGFHSITQIVKPTSSVRLYSSSLCLTKEQLSSWNFRLFQVLIQMNQ